MLHHNLIFHSVYIGIFRKILSSKLNLFGCAIGQQSGRMKPLNNQAERFAITVDGEATGIRTTFQA